MNERYLQQALSAISVRRNNAQTIQQQHLAEIAQTVPEIMEINQQLFHTSQDLIQIIRSGENVAERTQRLAQQNQQGQAMIRKLLVPRLQRYRLCKRNILPLPIKTCRKTCHKRTEQVSSSATLSV